MSFSGEVKRELLALTDRTAHCRIAELAAMVSGAGRIHKTENGIGVVFVTENADVAQKYITLLKLAADITASVRQTHQNKASYQVAVTDAADVEKLFLQLKIIGRDGHIREQMTLADGLLLRKNCCKRAFLRGAFLTAGSMSDPRKSYHFEIVCENDEKAGQIQELWGSFDLEARIVQRKNHAVVYLKEGSQIVDALNVMGAHTALMDLENVRIIKEMRNDINRRVNCETANINKTVSAAFRQQEAIRFLQEKGVVGELAEQLQEIAALRIEYPEATIKELGTLCSPPVGKSGVNHRLRRLEEMAVRFGYEKKEL